MAGWIERDGNKDDTIAAQANVSDQWYIIVNAPGAFIYGGNIPGTQLDAKSEAGRILLLLHELAHLTGTLSATDTDPGLNAKNNAAVWQNCQKTILGK